MVRRLPAPSAHAAPEDGGAVEFDPEGARRDVPDAAARQQARDDETFIHSAEDKTDVNRIILFCDVERPMKYGFMTRINRWVSHNIVKASATQNVDGEHVGAAVKGMRIMRRAD